MKYHRSRRLTFTLGPRRTWDAFLLVPHLDLRSIAFHSTVAFLAMLDIIFELLETVDGPSFHQEAGGEPMFPSLPDTQALFGMRLGINCVLMAVATAEVISSLHQWYMSGVHFASIATGVNLLSVVAFFLEISIFRWDNGNQAAYFTPEKSALKVIQLGKMSWFLGFVNMLPEVQALLLTFRNSRRALSVPLAMLFLFNCIISVLFYFLEPCYDTTTCAFGDLYKTFFFGLVTMSGVGYGNQVTSLLYSRLVCLMAMILGGVFFSMPLAIISQKYKSAYDLCCMLHEEMKVTLRGSRLGETMEETMLEMQKRKVNTGNERTNTIQRLDVCERHTTFIDGILTFIKGLEKVCSDEARRSNTSKMSAQLVTNESESPIKKQRKSARSIESDGSNGSASRTQLLIKMMNDAAKDGEVLSDDEPSAIGPSLSLVGLAGGGLLKREPQPSPTKITRSTVTHDQETDEIETVVTATTPDGAGASDGRSTDRYDPFPSSSPVAARACSRGGQDVTSKTIISESPSHWESLENSIELVKRDIANRNVILAKNQIKAGQVKYSGKRKDVGADDLGHGKFPPAVAQCIKEHKESINMGISTITGHLKTYLPKVPEKKRLSLKSGVKKVMQNIRNKQANKAGSNHGSEKLFLANNVKSPLDAFAETVEKAMGDSWRFQLFLLLDMPFTSREAHTIFVLTTILALLSVIVFFLQTMRFFHITGETSDYCQMATEAYCENKHRASADPGCFAYESGKPLRFYCSDHEDCFGQGSNFGSKTAHRSMMCSYDSPYGPFQSAETLDELTMFSSQYDFQQNSPLCLRPECVSTPLLIDGNEIWRPIETAMTVFFTLEYVLKFVAGTLHFKSAGDYISFFFDFDVATDFIALLPFYTEVIYSAANTGSWPDFNTLSTLPVALGFRFIRILKMARLLKIGRHMRSVKIVVQTIKKSYKRVVVNIAVLLLASIPAGYLLYLIERGDKCFAGDSRDEDNGKVCGVSEDEIPVHWENKILMVHRNTHDLSLIPNALYGFWLTVVTVTAEGYGRIYAVTAWGKVVTSLLIITGSIYLSIPVAVICDTFNVCFHKVVEDERKIMERMRIMFKRMKQRKGIQHELYYDDPPIEETGDPTVDKALETATMKNKEALRRAIKALNSSYFAVREELATAYITSNGSGQTLLLALRRVLRKASIAGCHVRKVDKAMKLYRSLGD